MFADPPYYLKAKYATVGLWVVSVMILVIMYCLNIWENKKRDREAAESGTEPLAGFEFMDMTDKENKAFRYVI
jgi:ACS family allantoate permease-like MFS transporter